MGTYGVLRLGTSEFLFDVEDLPLIENRDWYRDKDGYLVNINRNRADNRKQNLRCCKYAENDRNRGIYSSNKSGVAGVYYDKQRRKWVANISYNRKRVFLGRFELKEDAVAARLAKEKELFKEYSPQIPVVEV